MTTGQDDGRLIDLLFRLQELPGYPGRSFGRKLRRRLVRRAQHEFETLLAGLGPGDLCVDLGANVGEITQRLAATGAQVHAVEPDPRNFATLTARVGHLPNVTLYPAAIGATAGTLRMYRPILASAEPGDFASQGVTGQFRPGKSDAANAFDVTQLAFADFLAGLGGHIRFLKMDIEGAELDILAAMADGRLSVDCDAMFVETHEKQYPATWPQVRALRRHFLGSRNPKVSVYWV